jgi:hypothetical protein
MRTEAINNSITPGIDCVEHGTCADASSYKLYKLYKHHSVYLVPTLAIGERDAEWARTRPQLMDPIKAAGGPDHPPDLSTGEVARQVH